MNEFSLDGFDRIWARVQGAEAPAFDEDEALGRLLEQEAACVVFERCLARRLPAVQPLWHCSCERFGTLRTLWFLRTGERYRPLRQCALQCDPAQDLRKDILDAQKRADQYADLAQRSRLEPLRDTMAVLAEDTRRHAARLQEILRQIL